MIFYIVFFLIFLFSFIQLMSNNSSRGIDLFFIVILSIFALLLSIISGMKEYGVGADDINYIDFFKNTPAFFELTHESLTASSMEEGFTILVSILKTFSNSYSFLFFSIAFLSISIICLSYAKLSKLYLLCLLAYVSHVFLYREMIQIRAGLAYAIILFSYIYLGQKKTAPFVISILLASFIHLSSLAALLIIPFNYIINSKKKAVFFIVASFFISLTSISSIVIGYVSIYFPNNVLANKYILDDAGYVYSLGILNPTTIKQFFMFFIFCFFWDDIKKHVSEVFLFSYTLSLSFLLLFSDFAVFAARIASVFSFIEPVLFSAIIMTRRGIYSRLLWFMFFSFMCLVILYMNLDVKGVLGPYGNVIF